jgi:hypothetical protein
MRMTSKVACALVVGALAIAGCGDDESGDSEDEAAIEQVVVEIDRATADRDGAAYCELLQPSTLFDTFTSRARCVRETNQILEQAGEQPKLEVESVAVDGDTARVTFSGRSGEAPFIKEDGRWYLVLGQGAAEPADSGSSSGGGDGG